MATKNNIFKEHLGPWLAARGNRQERGQIIKHVCFVAGVHPKSVSRAFKRIQSRNSATEEHRGRTTYYTPDVTAALKTVWDIAGGPCAENLQSLLAEYVRILKRDHCWSADPGVTAKLLAMSLGTLKSRVGCFRRAVSTGRGRSTTKPGSILATVPIRSGPWSAAPAGTFQIDTVAHCGDSVAGDFVYTVNVADTATLWGSRHAQWNKGQAATVKSMTRLERNIPFKVREWHPDSGSEFINWHCHDWCVARGQKLTRSRPNRKNDNCFVEERNGHVVRRWVGYTRFDAPAVVAALNAVYAALTPYLNHFVASRRLVGKERLGAKWKVTREPVARTPYQRVLTRADIPEVVKDRLRLDHEQLNPLFLKREIDRQLKQVFNIQRRHGIPRRLTSQIR